MESETDNNNFNVKNTEESTSKIENGVEEGTDKEVVSDNLEKLDIWKQNADDDIP